MTTPTTAHISPSPTFGWLWNAGHECSYACGAGGCDGAGWRFTRRGAKNAACRYIRRRERRQRRMEAPWEEIECKL
jgi:hypothetical protein